MRHDAIAGIELFLELRLKSIDHVGPEVEHDDRRIGQVGLKQIAASKGDAVVYSELASLNSRLLDETGIDFDANAACTKLLCCGENDAAIPAAEVVDHVVRGHPRKVQHTPDDVPRSGHVRRALSGVWGGNLGSVFGGIGLLGRRRTYSDLCNNQKTGEKKEEMLNVPFHVVAVINQRKEGGKKAEFVNERDVPPALVCQRSSSPGPSIVFRNSPCSMPQRRPRFVLLLLVFIGLPVAGGCSGPATIQSRSLSDAPAVDGALDEWGGNLTRLTDKPVSMGAVPTDSLLYVAVTIQDRGLIRTVIANGLIVWVDPTASKQRSYGIQYPLGLRTQRAGQRGSDSESSDRAATPIEQVDLSTLDVVWHDSTRRRIPARFSSGLRAKATLDPSSLVYELAIPVGDAPTAAENREHGLPSALETPISIGLQTPEPDDEDSDFSAPDRGVPSVTGRPGRGRTRPGRRGRRRRAPRKAPSPDIPTLDLWTTVVPTNK